MLARTRMLQLFTLPLRVSRARLGGSKGSTSLWGGRLLEADVYQNADRNRSAFNAPEHVRRETRMPDQNGHPKKTACHHARLPARAPVRPATQRADIF